MISLKNIIIYLILIVLGVLILYRPAIDPDFGWHYKYGEYIVQNHKILYDNTFSYTFTEYTWANSYWVSQIILYALYSNLNEMVAGLLLSLLASVSVLIFVWKIEPKVNIKIKIAIYILLNYLLNIFSISVRPMLFSTLFLMILTWILYKKSVGKNERKIYLLPLMFLIWANTHADFVLGLFILCCSNIYYILMCVKNKRIQKQDIVFAILSLTSAFITLINPYGINLWTTLLKETNPYALSHIKEFLPFKYATMDLNTTLFLVWTQSLFIAAVVGNYYQKKLPFWYLIVSTFFFLISIRSTYFIRTYILIATPALLSLLGMFFEFIKMKFIHISPSQKVIINFAGLFLFTLIFIISTQIFIKKAYDKNEIFPTKAITYIQNTKPQGNIFNSYGWGGYMIKNLPEYKTFIDGRMPAWRENGYSLFENYVNITDHPNSNWKLFKDYTNKYSIKTILVEKNSLLAKFADKNKKDEWHKIYEDEVAVIFRNTQ